MENDSATVLVFGVFDGVHDGHRHFLNRARQLGDRLVVAVAPDEVVANLKDKHPLYPLTDRISGVTSERIAHTVEAGDDVPGQWQVVYRHKPTTIALGYDQDGLKQALIDASFPWRPTLITIDAHEPDRLHSRFFRVDS